MEFFPGSLEIPQDGTGKDIFQFFQDPGKFQGQRIALDIIRRRHRMTPDTARQASSWSA